MKGEQPEGEQQQSGLPHPPDELMDELDRVNIGPSIGGEPVHTGAVTESMAPRPDRNPFTHITRFGRSPTGRTIRVSEEGPGLPIYVVRYTPDNPSTPYAKPYGLGEWRTPLDNTPKWARVENSNFPPTPNQWVNEPKPGQLMVQRFGTDDLSRVLGLARTREVMLGCQEIFNENDANRPVRLIGYGIKEPGRVEPWILEEYVSEEDNFKELEKYVDEKGGIRLEQIETIRIILGVMEVTAKMNKAGITLGDMIQESNIFWDPKGQRIRVVDIETADVDIGRGTTNYRIDMIRIAQLFYYLVLHVNPMTWSDEKFQNAINSLPRDPVVEIMKQAFTLDPHDKEGTFKMYQELRGKAELFGIVPKPTGFEPEPAHPGGVDDTLGGGVPGPFPSGESAQPATPISEQDLATVKRVLEAYGTPEKAIEVYGKLAQDPTVGETGEKMLALLRAYGYQTQPQKPEETVPQPTDEEKGRRLDEAFVKLGSLPPNSEEERMEIVKSLPPLIPAEWDPEGPEMRTILGRMVPDEIDVFTKAMIEIERQRSQ